MEIVSLLRYNYRSSKSRIRNIFDSDLEFTKRIKHRYRIFWNSETNSLENVPLFFAEDLLFKWQNNQNWQRVLSNKHNSREFAKKHGCRVPDLYWRGKEYQSIDFESLPDWYVIRPTTGSCSKDVFLMHGEENLFDGKKYSKADIIASLTSASDKNPKLEFLFEEFLRNEKGEYGIQVDYKIYTFNGKIACIRLINRSGPQQGSDNYYDENWNLMPNLRSSNYAVGEYQDPPVCFDEMMDSARKLSEAYRLFVRIDFYATINGAVFGEFASTPSLGMGYTRSGSDFLVRHWDTFCKGMI